MGETRPIHPERQRERVDFDLPSGRNRSFDQWLEERSGTYNALRLHEIPHEWIKAAEEFRVDERFEWTRECDRDGKNPSLVTNTTWSPSDEEISGRASASYKRISTEEQVTCVGEALAMVLFLKLQDLERAELKGAAPVRGQGHISRRVIADVAVDMLECWRSIGRPPGPMLMQLLEQLLGVFPRKLQAPRRYEQRQQAIALDAGQPGLSSTQLANLVGVDRGTISRWRREKKYKEAVAHQLRIELGT